LSSSFAPFVKRGIFCGALELVHMLLISELSEKVGIGIGLYAADSHSILSDYFPLAAFQNSWINFRPRR
jgi:hypothetical protein